MKGFLMSVDTAIKFWQRCKDARAETESHRLAIMKDLLHEENIKIMKEGQIKEILNGKRVLVVKKEKKDAR